MDSTNSVLGILPTLLYISGILQLPDFCKTQLIFPVTNTFLPSFLQPGPAPPSAQNTYVKPVESFYMNRFYFCEEYPLYSSLSLVLSFTISYQKMYNCTEDFHTFMLLVPGTTNRSRIGLTTSYIVKRETTSHVRLRNNGITVLPPRYFCNLRNVSHLEIQGDTIASSENLGFSQQCTENSCAPSVEELRLSENNLEVLVDNSFCGFPNLKELDLSRNRISLIDDGAFANLGSLLKVSLRANKLVAFPAGLFEPLTSLSHLDLAENSLTDDFYASLEVLSRHLKVLILTSNLLTRVSGPRANGLESLMELYLDRNRIVQLEDPISGFPNLAILELSENSIADIPDMAFSLLKNLSDLNLSVNKIGHISNTHFLETHHLTFLNMTYNKLTSIPDLTLVQSLKKLVLNENNIAMLSSTDGARICGMNSLEELHLRFVKMEKITEGSLECNYTLGILNLEINSLRSYALGNVRIRSLLLRGNKIESFNMDDVPDRVIELDLTENKITELTSSFSTNLKNKKLTKLTLASNNIVSAWNLFLPPALQYLDLDYNGMTSLTFGRPSNDNDDFPPVTNLSVISLKYNYFESICPLILYYLAAEVNPFLDLYGNPLACTCEVEFLREFRTSLEPGREGCPEAANSSMDLSLLTSLSSNRRFSCETSTANCQCNSNRLYSSTCNLPCPQPCSCYLSADYNYQVIDCSYSGLDYIPATTSRLPLALYMSNNLLNGISAPLLKTYSKATELHLDRNKVSKIEANTFNGMIHLEVLNLEFNVLEGLTDGVLGGLPELRVLNLSHNQLIHLSSQIFSGLHSLQVLQLHSNNLSDYPVWKVNLTLSRLSLRDNPWSCDCDYVEQYRSWLQNYSYMVEDVSQLFCTADNGTVLQNPLISFNSSYCYVLKDEVLVTNIALWTSVLASLALVALLLVMVFIYRQEMQVLIYSNYGVRLFHRGSVNDQDADKVYDAFIAHSALDEEFLATQLIPGLEQIEIPYHLCIHQRDFLVGAIITDSILEAVEKSRRTIVVLSENFVRSEWCRFEFKSAHLKTLTDRCNRLIVIVLGNLPKNLDPEMRLYMKTNTYLEWGDRLFWEKLYFALPDRIPRECNFQVQT